MIFGFPGALTEIGLWVAFIITVLSLVGLIERWLKPFSKWFKKNITRETDTSLSFIKEKIEKNCIQFEEHTEYVRHHLGPNGNTPAIHTRIRNLENTMDLLSVRQKQFMNALDSALGELDISGSLVMANRPLLNLLQVEEWEVMGYGWRRFLSQDDYSLLMERTEYSKKSKLPVGPFPITLLHKNNEKQLINVRVSPLNASEESVSGFLVELEN